MNLSLKFNVTHNRLVTWQEEGEFCYIYVSLDCTREEVRKYIHRNHFHIFDVKYWEE